MNKQCECRVCKFSRSLDTKSKDELKEIIEALGFDLSIAQAYEEAFHLMAYKHYPEISGSGGSLVASNLITKQIREEIEQQKIKHITVED